MNLAMKLSLAIALAGLVPVTAQAQNQWGEDNSNPGEYGLQLGAGNWNCRHWLSSPVAEKEGSSWILGWWEATNDHNAKNRFVGGKLGAVGIASAVKTRCRANIGMALTNAVGMTYFQIGKAEAKATKSQP